MKLVEPGRRAQVPQPPRASIVSEPGHPGRSYQSASKREGDVHVEAETWAAATPEREGSWWPEWALWLQQHSSGKIQPPPLGALQAGYPPRDDAPGRYVLEP
jgi:polyhydroxyalkanoate synthase subunit PhaC